ncbi:MAG: AsmA-like C-terminal region-containing protein [Opitutae bacterium]|nr:AsmA-like C-terminal region-containing protein [Opitutae bacterium]
MSDPRPTTPVRFCLSCCHAVVCWAVWLVLAVSLVTLGYVALARELPVPDLLLRRAERGLAAAGFDVQFGRARFDLTGKILLEDVRVRAQQFQEPLLASRLVYLDLNFWSLLAGHTIPHVVRVEGALLQLPAMLSPSGAAEPLVRDLAGTLRHEGGAWHLDQAAGRVNNVAVTVQGRYTPPRRPPNAPPLRPAEIVSRFLQAGRRLALALHQLDACEQPALALRLETQPGVGNTAEVHFTARTLRGPFAAGLRVDDLAATATVRLDGPGPRPLRLLAAARQVDFAGKFSGAAVRAVISAQLAADRLSVTPVSAQLAAGSVAALGEVAQAPVVQLALSRWPEVRGEAAAQIDGAWLTAGAEAHVREGVARVHGAGRANPGVTNRVLARFAPWLAPYLVLLDPVDLDAVARFGPGWKFTDVSTRVQGGRLDSHGVAITSTRGRIAIDRQGDFLASDAEVGAGGNSARGSYWMNFHSRDYRILLTGQLRPAEISGWFRTAWWPNFWSDFDFTAAAPRADVDVSGCYRDPSRTIYFGRADTENAAVLGGDFEAAHTLMFLRPQFLHLLEFRASRARGAERVSGVFQRFADPVTKQTLRMEFAGDANLDPAVYRRMAGPAAAALLDMWEFTTPPQLHVSGERTGTAPHAVPNFTFTGRVDGPAHYYGFPLERVAVTGGLTGRDLRLDRIDVQAAGGTGRGKASLGGPDGARQLGFDFYVKDADLARTIRAFEEFEAHRTGAKGNSMTDSKFIQHASGGKLELSLSALGEPGVFRSFRGSGNAQLTGAELAEIHLFGLLSQALSAVSLNFSSLKLDTARSSFRLEDGRVHFPDLKISGPSAVLDAKGDYNFETKSLDFLARLKPYEETRNPLKQAIGIVLNPLASILELRLTGPLTKPSWSFTLGTSNPPRPAEPPPPPAAAEKPAETAPRPKR